jgi:hypothetical protein
MNTSRAQASFAEAWQAFYRARALFAGVLMIVMAVNIGVFLTVMFGGVIKPPVKQSATAPATIGAGVTVPSTTKPVSMEKDEVSLARSEAWRASFKIVMTLTAFVAIVMVVFMVFCALLGVMVLIAGQLPGTGAVVSAFLWSLLAALLLLWAPLLSHIVSNMTIIGLPSFGDLQNGYTMNLSAYATWSTTVSLWIGFLVYPILIILISIMYLGRTSQAHAQVSAALSAREQ